METDKRLDEFRRLLDIIDELRDKCPWDKMQTNESLRKLTIEEVYELADAIITGSDEHIKGELGGSYAAYCFFMQKLDQKKVPSP